VNYSSMQDIGSSVMIYLAPGTGWYFVATIILFIVAIHIHAIRR